MIFCGANLNSQDLDAFKEVNTVISCAMIQPFKTSSPIRLCRHCYKQRTALKQMLGFISFFVLGLVAMPSRTDRFPPSIVGGCTFLFK